jgi:hypothetical protein
MLKKRTGNRLAEEGLSGEDAETGSGGIAEAAKRRTSWSGE